MCFKFIFVYIKHFFFIKILAVVSHFVQQKKTVLVLGRVHMAKWPNWNQIQQQATVFLTQNISQV